MNLTFTPQLAVLHRPRRSTLNHQPSTELLRRGALLFRIYRQVRRSPLNSGSAQLSTYSSFTLSYSLHGRRHRVTRARREDLDPLIDAAETAIANGETTLLGFSAADRAAYQRCLEIAEKIAPLEVLVAEAVAARKRAQRSTLKPLNVPAIAAELLDTKRRQGKVGVKWLRSLSSMLHRLAAHFTGPLAELRAADLNAWLDGLEGGLIYRRHHRSAVQQLAKFAKARDYLPRNWNELELVDDPDPAPVKIRIWSPEQLTKLLAVASDRMVPFLALQAFGGLRHEEIAPSEAGTRKVPLDWRDFDWYRHQLHISAETGKTGERIVPLCDTLIAWLKPLKKESGPVMTLKGTSTLLGKLKRRAGLPAGRGESRNVLRKSWISYRIGLTNERGRVAEEAGTSLAKIKSNYRRAATEGQARAWFAVRPDAGDILQLDFFARRRA